ncbi:MAG: hypothetical protein GXC70_03040 [Sphingomonadaceae bacterium]|nr:hypothetical protein [Sphingomonadaceae bacterium]
MASLTQLLAPLALLLPALVGVGPARELAPAADPLQPATAEQVTIQQRVTIRINPRPAPMPIDAMMFDNGLDEARGPRWVERKMGNCLSANSIAGVQPIDNSRLLLFLNDRRLVTARLEKGCQGRDFYSGFMVQRSDDGMICSGRDTLRSRSGSTCQVTGFRQLVQVGG